jgi:NAD(P)-dependent dehydrogenase (short-subunit alcohol dehydrogenase family)
MPKEPDSSMSPTQDRKVVFITGAASGIGRETAETFVRRGWAVALADVNAEAGTEVEAQLRKLGDCTYFGCDVTDDDTVRAAVEGTVATYGRLDAAFNAAGIDGDIGKRTAEGTMENWNRVIAIDLTGTWSCMRYQLPAIIESGGGSIVNCASVAGIRAAATVSAYTAAKHGVVGLTKVAAREYARDGVRVNAICPGTVDTPMFRRSMTDEMIEHFTSLNPSGRVAQTTEIAEAAVWLCGDAPAYLTGQVISIDGGAGA